MKYEEMKKLIWLIIKNTNCDDSPPCNKCSLKQFCKEPKQQG